MDKARPGRRVQQSPVSASQNSGLSSVVAKEAPLLTASSSRSSATEAWPTSASVDHQSKVAVWREPPVVAGVEVVVAEEGSPVGGRPQWIGMTGSLAEAAAAAEVEVAAATIMMAEEERLAEELGPGCKRTSTPTTAR
jgi:hypothetical protein